MTENVKIKIIKRSEQEKKPLIVEVHRHTVALSRALKSLHHQFPNDAGEITNDVLKKLIINEQAAIKVIDTSQDIV